MNTMQWLDDTVLDTVKHELLTYKEYDADIIYRASEICTMDKVMYALFKLWMKELNDKDRHAIYDKIQHRLFVMEEYLF